MANDFDTSGDTISLPSRETGMVQMQPIPKPQLHFWYQRHHDGLIIDLGEQEAAVMEKNGLLNKARYIGVSDGKAAIAIYQQSPHKPGGKLPLEDAKALMEAAQAAELEVAQTGPRRRPVLRRGNADHEIPDASRRGL